MNYERKKLGFELLLSNLRSNLGRLILVNLIFALPLLLSMGIAAVLYLFVLRIYPVVLPLFLVLASPFYAGVVVLSRDYSQNLHPDNMLKTYFKAVKENGLRFLFFGVVIYLGFLGCYYGIRMYSMMATYYSWIFYIFLFFAILITLFFLFLAYAVPLMTVSFDLKQKDIYKNSALMTFGELKQNFFATIGVLAYLAVVLMPIIVISYLSNVLPVNIIKILLLSYIALAFGVLIPSPCAMIISHYLYPNMRAVISGDNISHGNPSAPVPDIKEIVKPQEVPPEETKLDIEELKNGDGEEYIFYQGKMIKRKVLLSILEQKEEENNND